MVKEQINDIVTTIGIIQQ